jgi:hypothetical protein
MTSRVCASGSMSQAARDWHERGQEEVSLYRGARLLEVEEWAAANPGDINLTEAAFLEAGLAGRHWTKRRTQMVMAGLTVRSCD